MAEAEPMMRRALAIDEQSLGPDHPNVARNLHNLAVLLQATNRLADAKPLGRRALKIWAKSLGAEHPNSQLAAQNFIYLLMAKGLSQEQAVKAVAEVIAEASRKAS
jgi:uncharacterized protein YoaH (UPF0181 family)